MIDDEPSPERDALIQKIANELRSLLVDSDNNPRAAREIVFTDAHRQQFGTSSVAIERDDEAQGFSCIVVHPVGGDVVADEDKYILFDSGELVLEKISVVYLLEEQAVLEDYDMAVEEWTVRLAELASYPGIDEDDEVRFLDDAIQRYKQSRSESYANRSMSANERFEAHDQAVRTLNQQIAQHLDDVKRRIQKGKREYMDFEEAYKAVVHEYAALCDANDAAAERVHDATIEANLRIEDELSPDVTYEQAWQLLKLLDVCDWYKQP